MIPAIASTLPRLDTTAIGETAATTMMPSGVGAASAVASQPMDFAATLSQVAADAVGRMKNAEAVSIQGVKGQASTQAVVDAVMSAERTLQTAVAIRDKVVSAYLDLSRMSI